MSDTVKSFFSTTCACGANKITRQSFCRPCYFALTADTKTALYRRMGNGYEEAYDEALDELRALKRIA